MSKKVITFYLVLAMIIMGKIGTTLFERSANVHHGQRVAVLQQKKSELLGQKQTIIQQLANNTALTDIEQSATENGFAAIENPLIVLSGQHLASR